MIAKLTGHQQNARRYDGKETVASSQLCLPNSDGTVATVARAEWYMGRSKNSSVVYCNLWVFGECSGTGQAGGYGYHKESAALQEALTSAGIELYGSPYGHDRDKDLSEAALARRAYIGGCGSQSCDEALKAIGRALGGQEPFTII